MYYVILFAVTILSTRDIIENDKDEDPYPHAWNLLTSKQLSATA